MTTKLTIPIDTQPNNNDVGVENGLSLDFNNQTYLTTKEAAKYLRKSESWLTRQHDIPYVRGIPNTYKKTDLDDWFERNKYVPQIA